MQTGLIVDSACELPSSFIRENNILVLPNTFLINGKDFVDDHDPERTSEFYDSGLLGTTLEVGTRAFSPDQIAELFLDHVVTGYDFAFCETISNTMGPAFNNATIAMNKIMATYKERRKEAGRDGPFSMRVVSSRNIFTGQAVLAAHTVDLIRQGLHNTEMRAHLDMLAPQIFAYCVPRDPAYLSKRTANRYGATRTSAFTAAVAKALDIVPIVGFRNEKVFIADKVRGYEKACEKLFTYAAERITKGLATRYISVNYAGDPEELRAMPGFDRLEAVAKAHGVELLVTMMGITCALYMGRGSVNLALAAAKHRF